MEISLDIIGYIVNILLEEALIEGLGPLLGAVVSTGLYILLKILNYEDVNGSADRDDTSLCKAAKQSAPEDDEAHPEPGSLTEEHAGGSEMRAENTESKNKTYLTGV